MEERKEKKLAIFWSLYQPSCGVKSKWIAVKTILKKAFIMEERKEKKLATPGS